MQISKVPFLTIFIVMLSSRVENCALGVLSCYYFTTRPESVLISLYVNMTPLICYILNRVTLL